MSAGFRDGSENRKEGGDRSPEECNNAWPHPSTRHRIVTPNAGEGGGLQKDTPKFGQEMRAMRNRAADEYARNDRILFVYSGQGFDQELDLDGRAAGERDGPDGRAGVLPGGAEDLNEQFAGAVGDGGLIVEPRV